MAPLASLSAAVRYCERGASSEFWAEPVNALTNAGYLLAALAAYRLLQSRRLGSQVRPRLLALIGVAATIGLGSAAFHTAPSPLTKFADVAPITVFVAAALYLALTLVLSFSHQRALAWLACLALGSAAISIGGAYSGCGNGTCLNGSLAYLPVLAALVATALRARRLHSPATPSLLFASAAFAFAFAARTVDLAVCPLAAVGPLSITAHALWHLGSALAAYLVLRGILCGLRITS